MLKFIVIEQLEGKPRPVGIGRVLCNSNGEVLLQFSKHIGIRDSNEAELMAIIEALRIYSRSFQAMLIAESDSYNVISWVSCPDGAPW